MKTVKAYEVGGQLFKDKKAAEAAEKELKKKEHLRYLVKRRDQALAALQEWEKAIVEAAGSEAKNYVAHQEAWRSVNARALEDIKKECDKLVLKTEPKFEVGDRVVLLDAINVKCRGEYPKGSLGTIRKLEPGPRYCTVEMDGGDTYRLCYESVSVCPKFKVNLVKIEDTPSSKFKVGDRVKVTQEGDYNGQVGEIREISPYSHDLYRVVFKEYSGDWFARDALEKIDDTSTPKFKVGDRVQICYPDDFRGHCGEITEVSSRTTHTYHVHLENKWGNHWFKEEQLDKMNPKFKVGDRVRSKCSGHFGTVKSVGSILTVTWERTKEKGGNCDLPTRAIDLEYVGTPNKERNKRGRQRQAHRREGHR